MGDNITKVNFGGGPYRELSDMLDELREVVDRYSLTVPTAGVLGVLRIMEHFIIAKGVDGL